ncbi:kyphoscoliosis peptidase [Denticeps clupeoides]|uniref:Transglutaminase-like domain-containing protein n=1 Tax=Denticeps clupeoides TaxID=299321 RepID=A0AAY4EQW8_9TELE|nr:kyphoscoliosis peptidase-like [Denticeps clupeoides]
MMADTVLQKVSFPLTCTLGPGEERSNPRQKCTLDLQPKCLNPEALQAVLEQDSGKQWQNKENEPQNSLSITGPSQGLPSIHNQNVDRPLKSRPAAWGLDKRVVFEQSAESTYEERSGTKRQLSAESTVKTVNITKKSNTTQNTATNPEKPLTLSGPALQTQRTPRKQLFKSTVAFQRLDTHVINTARELREKCVYSVQIIVRSITRIAKTELEKLRAIWVWLCHNIMYDLDGYMGVSPKVCSPEEVIKQGRGVCSGYSSICLEMCRDVGIECQEVSGYSKGIGYHTGHHCNAESDHMWNAVFVRGQWCLLDACWGAGRVDMKAKTFIKNFDDFYFLTEPSEFIDTHFPDQSEWQLLDTPLSWEEFDQRAMTSSAFYKMGLSLKQHHRVTTDDGEAIVYLAFTRPMSATYDLSPRPRHTESWNTTANNDTYLLEEAPEQGDSGCSPGHLSLTSTGMSLRLAPPEPGSYNLRLYARPLSDTQASHRWVCSLEVLCPSVREREDVPSNPYLSWGMCVYAPELGVEHCSFGSDVAETDENGECVLTIGTSRPLMMVCELAHSSLDPALAKHCLATQIKMDQLLCHVHCPFQGFYRLSVFVRDYDNGEEAFQNAGNFLLYRRKKAAGLGSLFPSNLSPWCGPGIKTQRAGLAHFSHTGAVVSAPQGRCNISFHKDSPDLQVHASLSTEQREEPTAAAGQSPSSELHGKAFPLSRYVFLTQMENKVTVSVCVPQPGVYRLALYGRAPEQQEYTSLCDFILRCVCQEAGDPFPSVYLAWGRGCVLLEPRGGVLRSGQQASFRVKVPGAKRVCVIGEKHTEMKQNKSRVWEGEAYTGDGTLTCITLAADITGTDNMAILLTWNIRNVENEP